MHPQRFDYFSSGFHGTKDNEISKWVRSQDKLDPIEDDEVSVELSHMIFID
jgi:hypothetical protein